MSNPGPTSRLIRLPPAPRAPEVLIPHRRSIPARPGLPFALAAALSLTAALAGGSAAAQEPSPAGVCPEGRISHIFIDNRSIFDVDELGGGRFMRGFYSLANALHFRTRQSFLRGELLFREGDCYDPFLVEESGRILRRYIFIAKADVFAVAQPDGTKHIVVDTQDEWTTRVDLGVSFDEGLQVETLEISEENVAGRGAQAAVFFRQRLERRDVGGRLVLPRLLGTRARGSISAGRTRDGSFVSQGVTHPFVGEVGRFAMRQTYHRRDELFPYAVAGTGGDYSHLLLPFHDERFELSVAGRLGSPGSLTLLGMGISSETLDFKDFPASLEIVRDGDFGRPEPAPAGSEGHLATQTRATSTTRLNLFVGQRNIRFVRAQGLDPLNGVQDVQLGTDVGLTLGRGLGSLSGSRLPHSDDLYGRLRLFAGHAPGSSFLFFAGGLEGRQVYSGNAGDDGWRDVIGEADLYAYLRSEALPRQTLFMRASGAGGWSMDTPFQLTLGGRSGVRGFHEEDFPGARRILLGVEDRIFLRWPAPDAFDMGFTVFADAGRIWGGTVPFGADTGWKGSVGGGLRLGFPAGTRGVVRMDLAFPLGHDGDRGPIFRVTLLELLGLFSGFQDPDLARSQRITVGPDYFTAERR